MNILSSYNGDIKNVVIPEGIRMIRGEEIAYGTEFEMEDRRLWEKRLKAPFSRDKRIESVSMGDSVVVIGPKAFEHCSNLKSIKLSNRLEVIGLSAFLGCKSLKEIHIPSSLKRIEDWAFSYCSLDKVIYDGTLLEADRLFLYGTELNTSVLETKDAVLNFKGGRFYIDDYFFPGTEREWKENYGNHWLNRRARRINTKDGIVLENECL